MKLPVGFAVLAISVTCLPAWGQFIISAKAGLINHVEGEVLLAGMPIFDTPGAYRDLQARSALSTVDGRAEVLLNPGLFLRLGENSTVRMLSNNLAKTRVEFVAGAAVIEPGVRQRDRTNWASSVSVAYKDAVIYLRKNGAYRFDAEPAQLRVYSGEATVKYGSEALLVSAGELISLANPEDPEEFDIDATDSLGQWSLHRTALMSEATDTAARQRRFDAMSRNGVWPRALINAR